MLDTNILVSMIFFPSDITRKFREIVCLNHNIIICDYVIKELYIVTERKFSNKKVVLDKFFEDFPFELVYTLDKYKSNSIPYVRDKDDILVLSTAIMEKVDYLITGDLDLRVVETERPKIMTMRDFLNRYDKH
ncbi:MAG: type II toxin-antitoxin system VapC family toxin [Lachnospiraceae bacterium]|jgi:predicted nucleic acid-binding protein|nr:type II toxin-antitoxin system VapC family toxin [Lachnospiraceae bacterium]